MTDISKLTKPSGIYSLRFYAAGATSGSFSGHEYQFLVPGALGEQLGGIQNGVSPTVVRGTLAVHPVQAGTAVVNWTKYLTATAESPGVVPPADGVTLTLVITTVHAPVTNDSLVLSWTESAVAKTADIDGASNVSGTNAANVSFVNFNRTTGVLNITFGAGHAPDTASIRVTYNYVGASASVTDNGDGIFSASGVNGVINYETGDVAIQFVGAAIVPYNGSTVTVDYSGGQAWSQGIRVTSSAGGYVEISFDGVTVHGRVENGDEAEYWERYEAGIAVRGSGNFEIEAW